MNRTVARVWQTCEHHSVEDVQESQLRSWAESLCTAEASDQRSMGKAMLMLFGQIDSLRAELEHHTTETQAAPNDNDHDDDVTGEPEPDLTSIEATAAISLRDRFRAAARRTTR
jgi:hypothetical protein